MSIIVEKTNDSNLNNIDFNNIPFGRVFTDHMYLAEYNNGHWNPGQILKISDLEVHPANMAWHYGQSIFEGMKAFKSVDGLPMLFRASDHAARLNRSAERMCMPSFEEEVFVDALRTLISLDRDWIPTKEGSSLYIRPFMFATDEFLGVAPSKTYKFIILLLPVGPYYDKAVSLWADPVYTRAAIGGTGEAKTCGNYAAGLLPTKLANEKGFDQILWLDGQEHKYVQEVGTMNIFFVLEDEIITPYPDGAILRGITRDSFLHILREKGHKVTERKISIDELVDLHTSGKLIEAFGSGTAAVATRVKNITYKDTEMNFDLDRSNIAGMLKEELHGIRTGAAEDRYGWTSVIR